MIELIPAIDLINGQCVRLTKGDYAQKKVYNDNPAEIAKQFDSLADVQIFQRHMECSSRARLLVCINNSNIG